MRLRNETITKVILFVNFWLLNFILHAHNPWGVKTISDYFDHFIVTNTIIAVFVLFMFKFLFIKQKFEYKFYHYILSFLSGWIISFLLSNLSFSYVLLLTQYFYIDKLVIVIFGFVNITGNFLGCLLIYFITLKTKNRKSSLSSETESCL
jgi:hypothetical protein